VVNSLDILRMLYGYNLKLILQGHLHMIEYIYLQNKTHFLVGGAVSAIWWLGPLTGMEEGFMYIQLPGGDIKWQYIDYGWDAVTNKTLLILSTHRCNVMHLPGNRPELLSRVA